VTEDHETPPSPCIAIGLVLARGPGAFASPSSLAGLATPADVASVSRHSAHALDGICPYAAPLTTALRSAQAAAHPAAPDRTRPQRWQRHSARRIWSLRQLQQRSGCMQQRRRHGRLKWRRHSCRRPGGSGVPAERPNSQQTRRSAQSSCDGGDWRRLLTRLCRCIHALCGRIPASLSS